MKSFFFYFLQVVLASGVLYTYYHFFLRNSRFHQYNRFYLLMSTLLSLVIPLLHIDIYFTSQENIPAVYQVLTEFRSGNAGLTDTAPAFFSGVKMIEFFYWLVASFLLIRFGVALLRIKKLRAGQRVEKIQRISLITTRAAGTPFSFFRWLFWNEKINIESAGGQKIFRHELFHIQQQHSLDIVYLELLTTVCWINPFFHLMKKETKAIHEFLADQFAAGTENKWEYAELLVMQALQTRYRLVNPFFHNQIKRRIAMITHSSTSKFQYLRKLMVLPLSLLLVTLIAFNCTSKDVNDTPAPEEKTPGVLKEKTIHAGDDPVVRKMVDSQVTKQIMDLKQKLVEDADNHIFTDVEIKATFARGEKAWQKFLTSNLNPNTPVDHGAPEGTYKVMLQFIVDQKGKISNMETLTHFGYGMEEEVLRVMKLSPDWSPAIHNGKAVKAYTRLPVTFVITSQ